ncbi:MAG: hypothetical protein ACK5N0_10025 [Synechococcaceae cyanobacterium]
MDPALTQPLPRFRSRRRGLSVGAALAVLPLLLGSPAARAATYTVTDTH